MMSFMKEFEHLKIQLEEIKNATNRFGNQVIGKGGFGAVYKGELSHSKGKNIVAIKRLNRQFGQGDPEFLKEIVMLSRYTHDNLISLLGYCDEDGEKILVYEYASNGSLDHHINDPSLTWTQRLKICIGAAKGLSYLHDPHGTHQRVLHCDIKSANILLDDSLNAKVADFGLAKLCPANQHYSFLVTNARGTPGYCDPLYMMSYTLTKESDIYSFGVVLFEVLCGRLCVEINRGQLSVYVPTWKQSYTEKKLEEIIFQGLVQQMDPTSLDTFSEIAFQCLQINREERPSISLIVEKLELALKSQEYHDLKLIEYADILKAAVPPLKFRSIKELNLLLSDGVFLNGGKTWFCRNDKGEHYVMISIAECLVSYEDEDESFIYLPDSNLRFEVGCYSTHGNKFKIHVRNQFLSPIITYVVNLVFKFRGRKKADKLDYLPLRYTLEGETKESVVYLADKREDDSLIASLNRFTSNTGIIDLQLQFEDHKYCNSLEIEGIELKPLEKVVIQSNSLSMSSVRQTKNTRASDNSLLDIKILCSYGGNILPRLSDEKLRYVGGDKRIIRIKKDISWQELWEKMLGVYSKTSSIKYQSPDKDLDALDCVSSDQDLRNMMAKFNDGSQKPKLFLFSLSELKNAPFGSANFEDRYIDALNSFNLI